jgi:hypothetical protein
LRKERRALFYDSEHVARKDVQKDVGIIRDLKKNNAALWRNGWTIEVVTEGNRQVFQIPFLGAD